MESCYRTSVPGRSLDVHRWVPKVNGTYVASKAYSVRHRLSRKGESLGRISEETPTRHLDPEAVMYASV